MRRGAGGAALTLGLLTLLSSDGRAWRCGEAPPQRRATGRLDPRGPLCQGAFGRLAGPPPPDPQVRDLQDPACATARRRALEEGYRLFSGADLLGQTACGQPSRASSYGAQLRRLSGDWLRALREQGDTVVPGRPLCLGLMSVAVGRAQAVSSRDGYILFDPRFSHEVNGMADRTMFSLDFIFAHEFAHQLQYWNDDPSLRLPAERRGELVADCVAATLLSMGWQDGAAQRDVAEGVVAAALRAGDLDFERNEHHGTCEERREAARHGAFGGYLLRHHLGPYPPKPSAAILADCRRFVDQLGPGAAADRPGNAAGAAAGKAAGKAASRAASRAAQGRRQGR